MHRREVCSRISQSFTLAPLRTESQSEKLRGRSIRATCVPVHPQDLVCQTTYTEIRAKRFLFKRYDGASERISRPYRVLSHPMLQKLVSELLKTSFPFSQGNCRELASHEAIGEFACTPSEMYAILELYD